MITTPHIKLNQNIDIVMDNISLKKIKEVKFLGMIIDSQLNFRSHINDVKLKVSKLTGVIFKVRDFMTVDALRLIYFCHIRINKIGLDLTGIWESIVWDRDDCLPPPKCKNITYLLPSRFVSV